jgi:uncharacterized protein (DUF1697 family)
LALVVLLRGVNVGGHRTFRPSALAGQLSHLDVLSIGAAGTFVVRRPVGRARLRAEFARRLPFETEIMIFEAREIAGLASRDFFSGQPARRDVVRFLSVLSRAPRSAPAAPLDLPAAGPWLVRILAREERYVVGVYRRRMKAIATLGTLDRVFGAPLTTRNWNTVAAIAAAI